MNLAGHWSGHCYYPQLYDFIVESVLEMELEKRGEVFFGTLTETCRIEPFDGEERTWVTTFRVSGREGPEPGGLRLAGRVNELKAKILREKIHRSPYGKAIFRCVLNLKCEEEDKLVGTFADPEEKKDIQQVVLYRAGSDAQRFVYRKEGERSEKILQQVKERSRAEEDKGLKILQRI